MSTWPESRAPARVGRCDAQIDGPTIDSNKYIDQHYYAIASKATLMEPKELNIPKEKFKEFFGEV